MKTRQAAIGSAIFFLIGPGTVVILIPWLLSRWMVQDPLPAELGWITAVLRVIGGLLIIVGGAFLVHAFVRFVREGLGTPVPMAPPERLVIGGVYCHVRNPMYVAITAAIGGQALLIMSLPVLTYLAVVVILFVSWVRLYEEPNLRRRFDGDYERYCGNVPGWLPRLRPWQPNPSQ